MSLSTILKLFLLVSMNDLAESAPRGDTNKTALTSQLKGTLLKEYDRSTPPPAAVVRLEFSLWQIISLSTQTQELAIKGWWRMYWKDTRLSWDQDSNNISSLTLFADAIWMPDAMVYEKNSGQDDKDDTSSPIVKISAEGEAATSISRTTYLTCQMDVNAFPFDKQNCRFTVGSQVRTYKPPLVSCYSRDGFALLCNSPICAPCAMRLVRFCQAKPQACLLARRCCFFMQ